MFWSKDHHPAVTLFPNPQAFFDYPSEAVLLPAVEESGGLLVRNVEAAAGYTW